MVELCIDIYETREPPSQHVIIETLPPCGLTLARCLRALVSSHSLCFPCFVAFRIPSTPEKKCYSSSLKHSYRAC